MTIPDLNDAATSSPTGWRTISSDDVDEPTRAAMEAHAAACAECGALLADLRKLRVERGESARSSRRAAICGPASRRASRRRSSRLNRRRNASDGTVGARARRHAPCGSDSPRRASSPSRQRSRTR